MYRAMVINYFFLKITSELDEKDCHTEFTYPLITLQKVTLKIIPGKYMAQINMSKIFISLHIKGCLFYLKTFKAVEVQMIHPGLFSDLKYG